VHTAGRALSGGSLAAGLVGCSTATMGPKAAASPGLGVQQGHWVGVRPGLGLSVVGVGGLNLPGDWGRSGGAGAGRRRRRSRQNYA